MANISGRLARSSTATPPVLRHLSNIQILRGVAAAMVVVYHISNELEDRGFPTTFPEAGLGSAGVDIFFVVSGFIILHSAGSAFGTPRASRVFLARRAARVVPLYWLVTTLAAVTWLASHGTVSGWALRWFGASYAFLFYPRPDGGDFPLYAQGWTLNFEMLFYGGFAAVLPLRRATALWALSVGCLVLVAAGRLVTLPWPFTRWTDTNIVEFVLGLALAQAHAAGLRLAWWPALALAAAGGAAFVLTFGSVDDWLPYRGFVWGPPALAVVAAAALYRPESSGAVRRAFEALGDASYALYLVHFAFFGVLAAGLGRFVSVARIPVPLYCALCFSGAVVLGFAVHHAVERPMTRGLQDAFGLRQR